jgi:DNA-binding CsgD family transcriptional regulator
MRNPTQSSNTAAEAEIGHVVLGGRRFRIMPATSTGHRPGEICRFEIEGAGLAVCAEASASPSVTARARDLEERLTARELQVAVLVAQGLATKNIAHRLQISEWTVGTYLRRVFAKLNVESRAAMVFCCAPLIEARLAAPLCTEVMQRTGQQA